jgi:hypothetical protein
MINESEIINDIKNSVGILSDETLVAQHPWVDNPEDELKRLKKQKEEEIDLYGDFGKNPKESEGDEE